MVSIADAPIAARPWPCTATPPAQDLPVFSFESKERLRVEREVETLAGLAPLARHIYRYRRDRERYFPAEWFGEPAWDMLLDLFIAHEERRDISVSSLCIAAAVPPSTALRWINAMVAHGAIARRPDKADHRRVYLVLSDDAAAGIRALLGAVRQAYRMAG